MKVSRQRRKAFLYWLLDAIEILLLNIERSILNSPCLISVKSSIHQMGVLLLSANKMSSIMRLNGRNKCQVYSCSHLLLFPFHNFKKQYSIERENGVVKTVVIGVFVRVKQTIIKNTCMYIDKHFYHFSFCSNSYILLSAPSQTINRCWVLLLFKDYILYISCYSSNIIPWDNTMYTYFKTGQSPEVSVGMIIKIKQWFQLIR